MKATSDHPYPRVGVATFVVRGHKVLLGLRHGAHGANTWGLPGGKLELGESWQACSLREIAEEAGITVSEPVYFAATNDVFDEGLHYVTIFMKADYQAGEASVLEPNKCSEWRWFSTNELPANLMLPLQNLLQRQPLNF